MAEDGPVNRRQAGADSFCEPSDSILRRTSQNVNFNPNWICREVVTVEVMRPQLGATAAAALVKAMTPDGTEKFGWLGVLNLDS